jgi:spermidine synthase
MRGILVTAFLEGMSVLIVEIAGARALAPYFGASLYVWTATITATLFFLALGYGLGGLLYRRGPMALPWVLWIAGVWLALFPLWRTMLLSSLQGVGVSLGAFLASAWLFGPPLCCLGSVSPLLIHHATDKGIEGGRAAGLLFLTNTLGGLAGGWLTALLLVPNASLRSVLAYTGSGLFAMGIAWAWKHGIKVFTWAVLVAALLTPQMAPKALHFVPAKVYTGHEARIVARAQSSNGLVQVVDGADNARIMLLDGVTQGGIDRTSGASYYQFSDYLAFMAHRYRPEAKRYLLLGLGCGVLAKTVYRTGKDVTVAEIEPKVAETARKYFGLPAGVHVVLQDGRTFLARDTGLYDVVILDAFAGEAAPWYLLTREALGAIKARLQPNGILVVNAITRADGKSEGLKHLEAGLLDTFKAAWVFVEPRLLPMEGDVVVNATLVAGEKLQPHDVPYPLAFSKHSAPYVGDLAASELRQARRGGRIDTDDDGNLDSAEISERLSMRQIVMTALGPETLQD